VLQVVGCPSGRTIDIPFGMAVADINYAILRNPRMEAQKEESNEEELTRLFAD
jgi:hypothetical protein